MKLELAQNAEGIVLNMANKRAFQKLFTTLIAAKTAGLRVMSFTVLNSSSIATKKETFAPNN